MTRTGRPPAIPGERRRPLGLSLGDGEIRALAELSALRGESQGSIVGKLVLAALKREKKRQGIA